MALSSWLIGTVIAVIVCKIFNRFHEFRKYSSKLNKLSSLKGNIILGNVWRLLFVPYEDQVQEFDKVCKKQQEAGFGVFVYWLAYSAKIMIIKGSTAEAMLRNKEILDKPYEYQFAKGFLGDGLLFSKKELWEKRRKMINPSFHSGFLKEFVPICNEKSDILMEIFEEQVEGKGSFDIEPYFRNFSLDALCQTVLGVNVDTQRNPDNELVTAHKELGDLIIKRIYSPWLWVDCIYYWTKDRKSEVANNRIVRDFAWKVIRERRQVLEERSKSSDDQTSEEICGRKRRKATLDVLLESTCDGRKLNDQEVIDEVSIQIAAGHETTASSMIFTLFLLGLHPEIQKKLQQELDLVLGESERPVTSDDLATLKFLEAVMKESHRLYPPVPFFGRVLDKDTLIDGVTIPAKTSIGISLIRIHRDPRVFPDPDKFDPERFLGCSSNGGPSAGEYMPFSTGPRNCVGYKVAEMEAKIVIAKIFRKYDVISHDKPEDIKLAAAPDLKSLHGIHVSLQRRKPR